MTGTCLRRFLSGSAAMKASGRFAGDVLYVHIGLLVDLLHIDLGASVWVPVQTQDTCTC